MIKSSRTTTATPVMTSLEKSRMSLKTLLFINKKRLIDVFGCERLENIAVSK